MLRALVEQILDQAEKDDRIILVNDGDKGSLPDFDDDRIASIEHCKPYYAIASAQNAGIDLALSLDYKWGIFIDDDCKVIDGWLEAHKSAWGDEETLYVGKQWDPRADKHQDVRAHWKYPEKGLPKNKEDMELNVLLMMALLNCSAHLPSLKSIGGLDEEFDGKWGFEDMELSYRLLVDRDWELKYLEDALLKNYRAIPGGNYKRDRNNNHNVFKEKVPEHISQKIFKGEK